MVDRVSRFEIAFDGDAGTIDQVLSGIKTSFRSAISDIERTASKLDLFGDITRNLPAVQSALDRAKEKVAAFRTEIDAIKSTGAVPIKALTDGLKDAEKAAAAAQKELNKQSTELAKLDVQLKAANVDTKNLAASQEKLAQASKAAAAAAELQAAKQLLGVKTLADAQPQIQKLQAAYETLRNSGTLSARETTIAQQALAAKIKETQGEVSKLQANFGGLGTGITAIATNGIARFFALGTVIGTATKFIVDSVTAAREMRDAVAEIGTVTNLTKSELADLSDGVRALSTEIGFDLNAGLKATFELLRSGVPADNVLAVLRVSAEAAKATLTDIGTTAKVSTVLLDSFGLSVDQLPLAFDKIIRGGKDGGATLKEFAENGGALGNAMRATNATFDSTIALLTVMTDASNDAAGSAATLSKVLLRLGDADVKLKLRELGIVTTNAFEIFRQLGEQDIGIDKIIELGVASQKTALGVAALTNNAKKLPDELDRIREAAGETAKDVAALYDTPKARADRFNAALHETSVRFGETLGSSSLAASALARYSNAFNRLADDIKNNPISRFTAQLAGVAIPLKTVTDTLDQNDRALARMAASSKAAAAESATLRKELGDTAAALVAQVKQIQAASGGDIDEINKRADLEIAALDRTGKATADTAAKKIAIETKAAADRLAVLQKNENDVIAAINFASAARLANEKRLTKENVQSQLDGLQQILGQYRDQYKTLLDLAQQHRNQIGAIEQERVDFNRSVEQQIRDIRLGSLSVFDQYVAKVKEVERLIAEARIAGANGQIELAKKYTDQAIALAGTVQKVVTEDGRVVVGQFEAQGQKIELITKAAGAYNAALDQQDTLAKQGLDAMNTGIDQVLPKITDLQTRIDSLSKTLATGLDVSVNLNEESIRDATATLDALSAPRTTTITVNTVQGNNAGGPIVATPFARGGQVIEAARRFAAGGSVFRRPEWSKVPGVGDGDTVPASLRAGSFVIKKAASKYYGDGLMSQVARGYAAGGNVTGSPFSSGQTQYNSFFADTHRDQSFFGDIQAGTTQSVRDVGQIAAPKLPTDKKELLRAILAYAADVLREARKEPQVFAPTEKQLVATIREYERRPDDGTLLRVLQFARNIGLNLGISNGDLRGFDIDGRRWHKEPIGDVDLFHALGFSPGAASYSFYARGGGVDSVPAMLTPGEWVMRPQAVAKYGPGLMHALNNMQVPRGFLDNVLNFRAPQPSRPAVAHFAEGGAVGSQSGFAGRSGLNSSPDVVVNLTVNATRIDDAEVDRLVNKINDRVRRSR